MLKISYKFIVGFFILVMIFGGYIANETAIAQTINNADAETMVHAKFQNESAIVFFVKNLPSNRGNVILSLICHPHEVYSSLEYEIPQGKEINPKITFSGDNIDKSTEDWLIDYNTLSSNYFLISFAPINIIGKNRTVETDFISVNFDISQHQPVLRKAANICLGHYNALLAK